MENSINGKEVNFAGFWRRFVAVIIDSFVIAIPVNVIFTALGVFPPTTEGSSELNVENIFSLRAMSPYIIYILIIAYLTSRAWQATPGKYIMRMFITDNGKKLTLKKAFFRAVLFPVCSTVASLLILFGASVVAPIDIESQENLISIEKDFYKLTPESEDLLAHYNIGLLELVMLPEDELETKEIYTELYKKIEKLDKKKQEEASLKISQARAVQLAVQTYPFMLAGGFGLLLVLIWYLPVAFTRQKTALHDIILNTRVVVGRAKDFYEVK